MARQGLQARQALQDLPAPVEVGLLAQPDPQGRTDQLAPLDPLDQMGLQDLLARQAAVLQDLRVLPVLQDLQAQLARKDRLAAPATQATLEPMERLEVAGNPGRGIQSPPFSS